MTFREKVGQAIGEASVCWSELPHGVFQSSRASELVDEIVAEYEKLETTLGNQKYLLYNRDRQIRALKEKLDVAREALGFYALSNLIEASDPYCTVFEGWEYRNYTKTPIEFGVKARAALEIIRGEENETK